MCEKVSIQPAVELLVEKGMARLYAEDVVRGFLQLVASHKHSTDPTVPYIILSGPINTFYGLVGGTPYFEEVSKFLDLKWGQLSLIGLPPGSFDTKTLTEQMLGQLQRDYGKQLSRSLQSWVFKGARFPHDPVSLIWSIGGHKAYTETVRVRCAQSTSNQNFVTA